MSKYIAFALTALLAITAADVSAQDDPKSRAILDQLITKGKAYKTFNATFTNRLESKADGLDLTQKGTVMAKGKKFKLQMDDFTIFCDGETVWTYSQESNEVTITDPSEMGEEELDPTKMLTMYEKGFKSEFIEEKKIGETACQIIKLYPIEAGEKAYHTIELTVDKAKMEPKTIKIFNKDGNEITYTLSKFKADTPMDDGLFVFPVSRYPGVEVNDMR